MDGFGQDIYWCHTQPTTTGATIGLGSLIAMNYLTLALVTYFHLSSISKQHQISNLSYTVGMGTMGKSVRRPSSMIEPINILTPQPPVTPSTSLYPPASSIGFELNSPALAVSSVIQAPLREKNNLNAYIFVHFLQHTPTTIYCICCLSNYPAWWVYFIFIAGFNLGGIGKVTLFHRARGRRPIGRRRTRALEHPPQTQHPATLSMGVTNPEFRRPAPSWQGVGNNNLTQMWMSDSNSTLATTNSPVDTTSSNGRPPTIHQINYASPSITSNPATTRRSHYPDSMPYVFRQTSASFGTNSDSSGSGSGSGSAAASVLASRRNVEVSPLQLGKSSRNTITSRLPDSTPEEEYEENDDDEDDDQAQPARAERVSLHQ
ncbi:hypothetical protein BGW37DRAFT_225956 [Umbelopsis sp. PMI_123]|nr:hypothetical protein BGW37DRAFT_225956 [Umbelopsis sp. PMI_123]